jgi:hypothetical protein
MTIAETRTRSQQLREGAAILASDENVRERMGLAVEWVERIAAELDRTDLASAGEPHALHDPTLLAREFAHTAAMLRHAARRALFELGATEPGPAELRHELDSIATEFVALWPARNRPGGLPDSLARLLRARALFGED